jgi:hypothetical protein
MPIHTSSFIAPPQLNYLHGGQRAVQIAGSSARKGRVD